MENKNKDFHVLEVGLIQKIRRKIAKHIENLIKIIKLNVHRYRNKLAFKMISCLHRYSIELRCKMFSLLIKIPKITQKV